MNTETIHHFEELLLAEKTELEKELETVGHRNQDNPKDWEPSAVDENPASADENELADTIEDYENNTAILKQLEIRYNEVLAALEKISSGAFGTCEVCGQPIEEDRLEANPAAKTCKAHMGSEDSE